MAFDGIYYPHVVQLGSNVISGITDFSMSNGIANFINSNDGIVDNSFVGVQTAKPTVSFTTSDIGKALDAAGISGLAIDEAGSAGSLVKCFFQKSIEGGARSGGSAHVLLTVNEGLIVPRTLSADNESLATLTYDIICTSAGGAAPIAVTTGIALSGTVADSEGYVVGPAAINVTFTPPAHPVANIDGLQSMNIDFGITEEVHHDAGSVYPVLVTIGKRSPVITLETMDATVLATYGPLGAAQSSDDSVFSLRAVAQNGAREADSALKHITFTVDDGMIQVESGSASGTPGSFEIKVTPAYDGAADVIAILTDVDLE